MSELSVIKWDGPPEVYRGNALSGFRRGWFGFGPEGEGLRCPHRWQDFLDDLVEPAIPYAEALRASVVKRQMRGPGSWHAKYTANKSIPYFSDNTLTIMEQSCWANFMAAVWSEAEDKDYTWRDFL